MKNEINARQQGWFKGLICLLFLLSASASFVAFSAVTPPACPVQNLTKTAQSTGSVSYAWSAAGGTPEYQVWYVRTSDNYTSSVVTTGSTSISFVGLPAGTYRFYFTAMCGQGGSNYIVDDVILI